MLSNNALSVALVVLFVAGAIVFVIGTLLARERHARQLDAEGVPVEPQTAPVVDVATRIDLVERLTMIGQPWCVEQLNAIRDNDPDDSVREAADAALTIIGSRPASS